MQITFYLRWCLPFASHVDVETIKTTATISQRLNILLSICGRKHNWFSCEKHFILQTNSRNKMINGTHCYCSIYVPLNG